MGSRLATRVRSRAEGRCEFCRLPDFPEFVAFEIDHVVPKQHGGDTTFENLAYACASCNKCKGPNLSGMDRSRIPPLVVRLFNPRRQSWRRHFAIDGSFLRGRTAIGRATVELLKMNDPVMVGIREELAFQGFDYEA